MAKINGARADEHTRKMFNALESKTEKDDKKNKKIQSIVQPQQQSIGTAQKTNIIKVTTSCWNDQKECVHQNSFENPNKIQK